MLAGERFTDRNGAVIRADGGDQGGFDAAPCKNNGLVAAFATETARGLLAED